MVLNFGICQNADKGKEEQETEIAKLNAATIYLRVKVQAGAKCTFSYSEDGINFIEIDKEFQAVAGQWIGAKVGLFATRDTQTNDSGVAEYDWFRIDKI